MMGDTEFQFDKEARDPFEAEETLSFSDLPITGDSAQSDYSYSKDGDNDDDLFEFISEDFSASTMDRDIIFCGKVISIESSKDAKQSNTNRSDDDRSDVLLPWILNKQTSKSTISGDSARRKVRELKDSKDHYSRGRLSLMRSANKSRWYLFMFRMPSIRLPAEMELRDIRNKQRRRNVPTAAVKLPVPAGEEEMVSKSIKGRRIRWFGKMIRSLGWGRGNTVNKQTTS
ncbi:hypothetical protein QN277_011448 [Acacia crassicarpa]|uniref:Uncharacterized protein n=1 Tax=Acacia crassicarpa TaxID=499986 RepID=A0AAE1MYM4_9FABA|nr:hypothetical protein QN277_011448 [Acacia crassicarpa]